MTKFDMDALGFKEIKESIKSDVKGRVILGPEFAAKHFSVAVNAHGEVLLTPVVIIPEREMWLFRNPKAMEMVQEGLAAAAAGRVGSPEDYSKYLDDTIDDE